MRTLTVLATALLLSSCAFHHYAFIPPSGNTAWSPEPESAVVILGFYADEPINSFAIADDIDAITLASALFPNNTQNAVAIHMHGGETFQLLAANYQLSPRVDVPRYMPFDGLPSITLETGGIHYYGSLVFKGGKGAFVEDFNPEIIELSKQLYPLAYERLKPANF